MHKVKGTHAKGLRTSLLQCNDHDPLKHSNATLPIGCDSIEGFFTVAVRMDSPTHKRRP